MRAPQAIRNRHRSAISGSLAALYSVVTPLAVTAASNTFSVAPTLGNTRVISHPDSPLGAVTRRRPPLSSMTAPSCCNAARCQSMGRGPNSQPPGNDTSAAPRAASNGPKKIMEERICRISSSAMRSANRPLPSTRISSPSCVARQPSARRMDNAARTSDSSGQFFSVTGSGTSTAAASSGNTLFLAPWMRTSPVNRRPPSTYSSSTDPTLSLTVLH